LKKKNPILALSLAAIHVSSPNHVVMSALVSTSTPISTLTVPPMTKSTQKSTQRGTNKQKKKKNV
jgi:hypothetical protein